jgi:hypothetical protein
MRGRRIIERRSRIFIGCEGESEQGYGVFLQRLADAAALNVHIVTKNLQPAGDPLALAQKAVHLFDRENRKAALIGKAIMLDADRLSEAQDRGRQALELLSREQFTTIWQRPDHEGFLLRHFPGHEHDDPPRGRSIQALQAVWPGYRKNMAAADLQRVLTLEGVAGAARVTAELMTLLRMIGLERG